MKIVYKLFYLLFYPSYEQEAPESFHVSMACVEPQSASGGATSIYLDKDGEEFLLCNLRSVFQMLLRKIVFLEVQMSDFCR